MEKVKESQGGISCKICGREFSTKVGLMTHINRSHPEITQEEYYVKYIGKQGICPICGKTTKFIKMSQGFNKTCGSTECHKESRKRTMMEKYGVENAMDSPKLRQKIKDTLTERYGVDNAMFVPEFANKVKQTNLEKYGTEYPQQTDVIKDKIKQTNLKKYGVEYSLQRKDVRKRIKQTNLKKYGGTLNGSPIIKEKSKKTMLEKYGVEHALQNKEIRNKVDETNLERYGEITPLVAKDFLKEKFGYESMNLSPEVIQHQKEKRNESIQSKYGVTNISQLKETQETIKKNNLEKYGVESTAQLESVKQKIATTYFSNFGKYCRSDNKFVPNFSLSSQKLFNEISLFLNGSYLRSYYATNKGEYKILTNNGIKYLDFYIPKLNKWIEFDEKAHNRLIKVKQDNIRTKLIKESVKGIELLRIKEKDYIEHPERTIKKCLKFILGKERYNELNKRNNK